MQTSNDSDNKDNIKVIIRIRPKIDREYSQNSSSIFIDGTTLLVKTKKENKQFTFDYIANEDSSQSDIFDHCAREICDSVLEGYNGTIFVYGQTGAGKTYTLLGSKYSKNIFFKDNSKFSQPNDNFNSSPTINQGYLTYTMRKEEEGKGILPRAIEYIFDCREKNKKDNKIEIKCSYLELYNEQISDLLDYNSDKNIIIRDISDTVIVENLNKISVNSIDDALNLLREGNKYRHIASTNMNKESSRSHAVFSIYIDNTKLLDNNKMVIKHSMFHLIDLAGSERQKNTQCIGERIKEAGKINKSLMQLSHVIKNLSDNISKLKNNHIHYRDSKLTHLLKDSLGGTAKTCIICNVSPAFDNLKETISTLIFAQSAKMIKNKVVINEELCNQILYNKGVKNDELIKLREKYAEFKKENYYLMSLIEENQPFTFYPNPSSAKKGNGSNTKSRNEYSKTIDYVEEEIDDIIKEIKEKDEEISNLKSSISTLKDKFHQKELELKIKENELNESKIELNAKIKETELLREKVKDIAMKNAYQTQDISVYDLQNKEILKENNDYIDKIKNEISLHKDLIITKDNIIRSIKEDFVHRNELYNEIVKEYNKEVGILEDKKKEKNEMIIQIEKGDEMLCDLKNEESELNNEISKKEQSIMKYTSMLTEAKEKVKTIKSENNEKIKTLQLKKMEVQEKKKKAKDNMERQVQELDKVKGELQKLKEEIEGELESEKTEISNKLNSVLKEKETLKKELKEEKDINIKLNAQFDVLTENQNVNYNKTSLLTKIKNENTKLKEELDKLKSQFDNLHFELETCGKKRDFTTIINQKEQNLNSIEFTLDKAMNKLKYALVNKKGNILQSDTKIVSSSFDEERFNLYLDKYISSIKEDKKMLDRLKEENIEKEKELASYNRELMTKKQNAILCNCNGNKLNENDICKQRKSLVPINNNRPSFFNKKRTFKELVENDIANKENYCINGGFGKHFCYSSIQSKKKSVSKTNLLLNESLKNIFNL